MKCFSIFLLFLSSTLVTYGQSSLTDDELLQTHHEATIRSSNEKGNLPLRIYKNHISEQILNDCIYDHSCSKFSGDALDQFGILKGLLLTVDRLTRCNRAAFSELHPNQVNLAGKAIDHAKHYEKPSR